MARKWGVALSSGTPFSFLFPNVKLQGRAEQAVSGQKESAGYPRYNGDPDALLAFASSGVMTYATGARFLKSGSINEATKVLEFGNLVVNLAVHLAAADESTELGVELGEVGPEGDDEPAIASNNGSPEKEGASGSAATPKAAAVSVVGKKEESGERSIADSREDAGAEVLHEFVHGKLLKELSVRNHTEFVIAKRTPEKARIYRGALELSKNLLDQELYKKKKEQVPSTAVSLSLLNFDNGILDRRTYVVCSDGNVGYGCCFTPDMKGVTWRPGKMKGKDIKGVISFSNCFQIFNKVALNPELPLEATKSTLYGLEVIARLCAPELSSMDSKGHFWKRLGEQAEVGMRTAVRVLEPMFLKPAFYDDMTFKDGKRLPGSITDSESGLHARACATSHLRDLAEHYQNLSAVLMSMVDERTDKEKEDRRTSFCQYVESAEEDELARIEELLEQRKRRRVSGGPSAQG